MYRSYDNVYKLEEQLKDLKEEYGIAKERNASEDTLISLACDIKDLEERINFTWQDEEYDECY